MSQVPLDERALSRLRWRCRRGMLENDLILERFLHRHGPNLSFAQADCLNELLELSDNDLLDILLGKKALSQLEKSLDRDAVREVLGMLREYR